jgi:hypothetical protein
LCNHLSVLATVEWLADQSLQVKLALGFTTGSTPHQSTFQWALKKIGPIRLLKLKRGHWGIENKLHWVKDVVLGEDKSPIHVGAGPQVVGAIRNTVLNVLRKGGHSKISAQLRRNSRNPIEALSLLGISISSA